jgi:predicted glycoside hydrolase/deacetylase ChbG (UPF0249 family)
MKLIINADDFGLTKATNKAVLDLASLGTISSTTVMVNMPYTNEAVKLTEIPDFGIGLHFNLTEGSPISSQNEIPTLVNENGRFFPIHDFRSRIKAKKVCGNEILKELNAQFTRLKSIIGQNISHIDSHQDIIKFQLIHNVLIDFVDHNNLFIGLRWYNKMYLDLSENSPKIIEPSLLNLTKFGLNRFITETYFKSKRKKLRRSFNLTDGMLYSEDHNMRTLLKQLTMIPSGFYNDKVLEVMVHPATSTDELSETKMLDARVEEYEILKSPIFQKFIQKNELLSFADLK